MTDTSPQFEWHALFDDCGEGEPWMAYVEGHHDLFILAPIAEAGIREAFPRHQREISDYLDAAGGAVLAHVWLVCTEDNGDSKYFEIARAGEIGAFAVTGVRFDT
ncbi:hypothetical protein ASF91_19615 [Rhizobium sp. Leaf155]|nr:hypothetical protein ASF91_19615 [Rhizobium sp. Leaf155]